MGSSYTRHPGAEIVNARWAVPVPILPDEIISSWLVRAAFAQGASPFTLTGNLWPNWRPWTLDIDRGIESSRLSPLVEISGTSIQSLHAASLLQIASQVRGKPLHPRTSWPWILSLGIRNTNRQGGMQYCPCCLFENGTVPYFRMNWRLGWHTGCLRHRCRLADRCWSCGSAIQYHRLEATAEHLAICPVCQVDFRNTSPQSWDSQAEIFQEAADYALQGQNVKIWGQNCSSADWFKVMSCFVVIIRRACCLPRSRTRQLLKLLKVKLPSGIPQVSGHGISRMRTSQRIRLFAAMQPLLEVTQEMVSNAFKIADVRVEGLFREKDHIPPPLEEILQHSIKHSIPKRRPSRHHQGKRPPWEVRRMLERLEQKLESITEVSTS